MAVLLCLIISDCKCNETAGNNRVFNTNSPSIDNNKQ